jgi:hypothetical protein
MPMEKPVSTANATSREAMIVAAVLAQLAFKRQARCSSVQTPTVTSSPPTRTFLRGRPHRKSIQTASLEAERGAQLPSLTDVDPVVTRFVLTLISSIALIGSLPASAPAASCRPPGAKITHETARLIVVELRNRVTQVCDRKTRRTRRLDSTGGRAATVLAVADRYVAFQLYVTDRDGVAVTVRLLDGVRRKVVATHSAATGSHLEHQGNDPGVHDLALEPSGDMAWISEPYSAPGLYEVWKAARSEGSTLLEVSREILPESLALSGSWLYWNTTSGLRAEQFC